jgi:cysteinyl-tRNA synthetase
MPPSSDHRPSSGPELERPGLLGLIGNTPLVRLERLVHRPKVELWAKLERANPGGSVKDRIALSMLEAAEKSGELRPGKTILEATSGNTGIGLALVAALKGYPVLLAMSEGVSVERRKILAALGAEFLLTPAAEGTDGAIERAYALAGQEPEPYFLADQYNNPANVWAHYQGTAPEIWQQTEGRITHFVASMGTTGTLMGCAKRLHELNPAVRVVGVEPYLGHKIQGLKNLKEAYVPGIFDPKALDEKINVEDDVAYAMARRLAREEGLLVGMSSGAAAAVACELCGRLESGVVVVVLPDGGERYLSTPLFQVPSGEPESVPQALTFLNTLTRRYQPFVPLNQGREVSMYSCGPTVHTRPHLGLLRRLLVADLVRRTLEFEGYQVKHVVSITDLDDNTIQAAEEAKESMRELCRRHEAEFLQDLAALGARPAEVYARTSESIEAMLALTRDLIKNGAAYEKLKSVYFNIGRVSSYGELSGKDLGKIRVGMTVDLDRYDKDDPRDFTLLKRSTLQEIRRGVSYKTEWGNVRPSWHVQCSAMARAHLGERFDIHTASVDLMFPHNENELAQSRALGGDGPANYWLHSELVLVGGKKIGSTRESEVTLPELVERGYSHREIRLFLLGAHYRQPVHLSDERLQESRATLRRLDEFVKNLRAARPANRCTDEMEVQLAEAREGFRSALHQDVNLPLALAQLFRLVRQVNYQLSHGGLCADHLSATFSWLEQADQVLALLPLEETEDRVPPSVLALVRQREAARESGDFVRADQLRSELVGQGYSVEDRPEGTRVSRRL